MIRLERGERPKELTEEVCEELSKMYMQNRERDVWNSPKIKKPLKDALLKMSHKKCAYCECELAIESKDVTIDHFMPKSANPKLVVQWENLFPACLRCNREKNDCESRLVNPCLDNPREYLGLSEKNRFRLKGIDSKGVGENTVREIFLNDVERVMVARMREWEDIHQRLEDILEEIAEAGYKERHRKKMVTLMGKCTAPNSYAAVKASNMLDDDCYLSIKNMLQSEGKWTDTFSSLEEEMRTIALQFI